MSMKNVLNNEMLAPNPDITPAEWQAIITQSGKFEGEPLYVRYYYELMINGAQDDVLENGPDGLDVFFPDSVDRMRFGLDNETHAILLNENDQGSVTHQAINLNEYNELKAIQKGYEKSQVLSRI